MADLTAVANGYEEQVWMKLEDTFGTFNLDSASAVIQSDYAVDHTGSPSFVMTRNITDSGTKTGDRSRKKRVAKRWEGSWSLEKEVRPSGTVGTAPSEKDLLEACMGTETIISTSVTYAPSATARKSLCCYYERGYFAQRFVGIAVDTFELAFNGEDEAKWTFGGFLKEESGRAGTDTLDGGMTSDATSMTLDDSDNFYGTIPIMVSDEQMLITANSRTTEIATVTRGWGGTTNVTHSDGLSVIPVSPIHTDIGTPIVCPITCSIDTAAIDIISGSVKWAGNLKNFNDETKSCKSTGYNAPGRLVTATLEMRLYSDQFYILQGSLNKDSFAIVLTFGETAGSIVTVSLPVCEIPPMEIPSSEGEVVVTLELEALASVSGNDELSIVYT